MGWPWAYRKNVGGSENSRGILWTNGSLRIVAVGKGHVLEESDGSDALGNTTWRTFDPQKYARDPISADAGDKMRQLREVIQRLVDAIGELQRLENERREKQGEVTP